MLKIDQQIAGFVRLRDVGTSRRRFEKALESHVRAGAAQGWFMDYRGVYMLQDSGILDVAICWWGSEVPPSWWHYFAKELGGIVVELVAWDSKGASFYDNLL